MGIEWKQVFDFEMTPVMATAVWGSLFVVCSFAGGLSVKLWRENQRKLAAKKISPATNDISAETNIGDGI